MIVGTAGHIDHGKTSLVRALTGIDTDRLKEEKARGITIDLGFAYLPGPGGATLGFVDVPGHERFVHTMVAGASGIDHVLVVVAADDGPMPQTLEHLAIVDLLGIRGGVVALTKTDLVDAARRDEAAEAIRAVLAGTGLAGAEIVPVSTATGEGIERLRSRLLSAAGAFEARPATGRFRLAVDRSFTLPGAGTIVTGTVLSGEVRVGDRVLVSPRGLAARVRSLHAQNRPVEVGRAGDRCALNLAGEAVSRDAIVRGDTVIDPALHAPTDRIDAELRLLPGAARSVDAWFPARLHHAAAEVGARIVPLQAPPIAPGETGRVQLVLDRAIAASAGDRFVLRDTSAQDTLGGGRFLDLRPPTRRRRTPQRLAQLDAHAMPDPAHAVGALLDVAPHAVDLDGFARDRALGPDEVAAIVEREDLVRLPVGAGTVAVQRQRWAAFEREIASHLAAFHAENPDLQGIGLERLRLLAAPHLPAPLFRAALQTGSEGREIALAGSWVRLASHVARLTEADEAAWRRIAPMLGAAERFRPPRVRDVAGLIAEPEDDVRRLLKLLGRQGQVDEVAHDHFFLRGTVAEMVAILRDLSGAAPEEFFTAAQFRDRVQNGRKVAIQVLDFFDRHGVTLRRGDLRKVNRHRLDLFGPAELGTSRE